MDTRHTLPLVTQQYEGNENHKDSPVIDSKKFADSIDINKVSFTSPNTLLGGRETAHGNENELSPKLDTYNKYRITDRSDITPPIPIITIAGEVISTEGNITTISGQSKSGKSALNSILLAGAISEDGIIDGLSQVVVKPNSNKKAVLHFDTEQARHKQQNTVRAILRRCKLNTCPDHFRSYSLRELNLNEYAKITENIFRAADNELGGIHLAVIDGIADYIKDVNDAEDSNAIIKFFEGLAVKYNVPIILIVHTNPGSDKERGHLGSQLQRKSESVISVKLDGDISYIEPKLLRMAEKGVIPQIAFKYDKDKGYHVEHGVFENKQEKKLSARSAVIIDACEAVFSGQTSLAYGDATDAIMKHTGKGITTVKHYFTEMRSSGLIVQGDDDNWRYAGTMPK